MVKSAIVSLAAAIWLAVPAGAAAQRWGANYFPDVTLTTQHGQTVRFYDDLIKDKIVALNLIYTSCRYACPLETARLAQVQKLLGDRVGRDIFFYSITIDPAYDTPAVLKAYAERYQVRPGWLFLTGRQEDIDLISRKLGLDSPPDPSNPDGHTPSLVLGNAATGQWTRHSALSSPAALARTIGDWLTSWQTASRTPVAKATAAAPPVTAFDRAQYMFGARCAACHTIGGGDLLGPDLAGVTAVRDRSWLTRFIAAPEQMNEAGDPVALALRARYQQVRMPNLGLTERDAAALIDYIAAQSRTAAGARVARTMPASSSAGTRHLLSAEYRSPVEGAPISRPSIPAAVLTPYLRVHEALSADRLEGLKEAGEAIAAAASTLAPGGAAIVAVAGSLQRAANLNAARAAFGALTDVLLAGGQTLNTDVDDIHVAYCPMARKHWLQKGDQIRNPYHGQQMLDCGRIVSQSSP